MQISHQQILFCWNDTKKQLMLTNNTQSPLIFKIKTTDIQLLTATPNRGFIEQRQTKNIEIICKKSQNKFDAKLQVMYAAVEFRLQNFDATWNKIQKKKFHTNIILLTRKQQLEPIQEEIFQSSHQKIQRKIQQSMSQKSAISSSFSNSYLQQLNRQIILVKQNTKNDGLYQHTVTRTKAEKNFYEKGGLLNSVTSPLKNLNNTTNLQKPNDFKVQKKQSLKVYDTKIIPPENSQINLIKEGNKTMNVSQTQSRSSMAQSNRSGNLQFLGNIQRQSLMNGSKNTINQSGQSNLPSNYFDSLNPSQLSHICLVQAQLLAQKQQNQRLKQQIKRTHQIQKDRRQRLLSYQTNRSMREQRVDNDFLGINFPILFLIILVFFTIGTILSRF